MDRDTLQCHIQRAESLMRATELDIALQHKTIAQLERCGHDVTAAMLFLKWLEAKHGRQLADRDRLFGELANRF